MIAVFDIRRQNEELKKELQAVFDGVVEKGIFILGEKVSLFEKEFASYIGVKYAVGVASGTDAISLSLMACGIERGDEVIIPANSYPSVFGVVATAAIPKLIDIDPLTYNINPVQIEKAITKKTRAIMPVHLYGQPAQMESILAIAKRYNLKVIEDCAQAVGAEVNNGSSWKKVGSIGHAGCFSFYPTKNLGAFGDGGMVTTDNEEIYQRLKLLRMYGEEKRYHSVLLGRNSRLDELQAAILLVKLKYLDKWIERRREIANLYKSQISNLPPDFAWTTCPTRLRLFEVRRESRRAGKSQNQNLKLKSSILQLPFEATYTRHTYHLFVIRSKQRDELKEYLANRGVGTGIHYPKPIHLQPSFAYLGHKEGDFPESEKASREVLSLPMWPELTKEEVSFVVQTIREYIILQ